MTPTEKDAMALAVLAACEAYIDSTDTFHERPAQGSPLSEHRKASAHLAARLAELEAERDKLAEKADKFMWQVRDTCTRAERAEAELAEAQVDAKFIREAYFKAEAELAAVREAVKAARRALARASESDPAYLAAYNELDAAIDAARGEGK